MSSTSKRTLGVGAADRATSGSSALFRLLDRFSPVLALCGIIAFAAVALFGFGKASGTWMTDFYWYYVAGICAWSGNGINDAACVAAKLEPLIAYQVHSGLAYPPNFTLFAMVAALLPRVSAAWAMFLISSSALILILLISFSFIKNLSPTNRGLRKDLLVAIVFGASGTWAAIWLGQITPILAACLWLAFKALGNDRPILGGALLAIVAVKPQMAIPFGLWLLLNRKFLPLIVAFFTSLLLSAYPFMRFGIEETLSSWIRDVGSYGVYSMNKLGSDQVLGLPSYLAAVGIPINSLAFPALIGVLCIALVAKRTSVPTYDPLALAFLLTVQMGIASRQYDLVALAPAFAIFWPRSDWPTSRVLLFLAALLLYSFPTQIVTTLLTGSLAGHFRTLFLVFAFGVLTVSMVHPAAFKWRNENLGAATPPHPDRGAC